MAATHRSIARKQGWREGRFAILRTPKDRPNERVSAHNLTADHAEVVSGFVWRSWGMRRHYGKWQLTHLPTGLGIEWAFPTITDCTAFASDLDALTDWSRETLWTLRESRADLRERTQALLGYHPTYCRAHLAGGIDYTKR